MKRTVAFIIAFVLLFVGCFCPVVLPKSANTGVADEYYLCDGSIVKHEEGFNPLMADYAIRLFERVCDEQLDDTNRVYYSIIPDKEKLVEKGDTFDEFLSYYSENMDFATQIEIHDLLELSDYYHGDPHWRQESIVDVAQRLCEKMGTEAEIKGGFSVANDDFFGVYEKDSGLVCDNDAISYMDDDGLQAVYYTGPAKVYDTDALKGADPYDFFLKGNQPLVTLINENAENEKRLVVFRDSFASSIAPLLATGYSEVVLVDLRYVMSEKISDYVDFESADVLFMYSTLLLNNSMSMK